MAGLAFGAGSRASFPIEARVLTANQTGFGTRFLVAAGLSCTDSALSDGVFSPGPSSGRIRGRAALLAAASRKGSRHEEELIPGWLLMAGLAGLSLLVQGLVTAGGKHPLEASAVAVVLGLLLRNLGLVPKAFQAGIKAFEKFLIWGVILIGASLNFKDFRTQGVRMLAVILVTMTVGFVVIYTLARIFKLPATLSTLLAVGTTICGGTAIAITAPLVQAKEEETKECRRHHHHVGLLAILIYPQVAGLRASPMSPSASSPARPSTSTPQVVGGRVHLLRLGRQDRHGRQAGPQLLHGPAGLPDRGSGGPGPGFGRPASLSRRPINAAKAFPWFLFGFYLMAGGSTRPGPSPRPASTG